MRHAARVDGVYLGSLCRKNHEYSNTGKSRRYASGHCIACVRLRFSLIKNIDPERWDRYEEKRKAREAIRRPAKGRKILSEDERREYAKQWKREERKKLKERVKARAANYYKKNSVRISLRNRFAKALKHHKIIKKFSIAGYEVSLQAIVDHLGPCPGVRSEWHIDHIKPLAAFDLRDMQQIKEAFAPSNHRWLPARENLMKHAKYDGQARR